MSVMNIDSASEYEKRAATLAVSRFGADRARVQAVFQGVLRAQSQGESASLLEALVVHKLLTSSQASELRLDLDGTQIDAHGVGSADAAAPVKNQATSRGEASGNGKAGVQPTSSGYYLRTVGDYRLLRRLGEGGMGSVYLGYREGEEHQVAIKVLSDSLATNKAYVDRFYREAKSGSALNHPNIVRCITAGRDAASGKHYLVLQYVDGPSARALLDRFGKLAVADAVHIITDIARALEHVHSRNFVHRDIKPDNILITKSGVAKLADLGLAKCRDEASHLTAMRQGFGTPYYMPYEQAINAKVADGRSDIFALGASLYHLVTGEVPFPGESHVQIAEKKIDGVFADASSLNSEVPASLDRILAKMLARDPGDRYQTASELLVDLDRANLAAGVPSFVDIDLALKDPLVRQRLAVPNQPTKPDLETPPQQAALAPPSDPNLWFVRFQDAQGRWCKSKATTEQILERLRGGRLPAKLEAARKPQGVFRPLADYPEFRGVEKNRRSDVPSKGLERQEEPRPAGETPHIALDVASKRMLPGWAWLAAGLILSLLAAGAVFLLLPR